MRTVVIHCRGCGSARRVSTRRYEILIVGAGPIGLATAALLAAGPAADLLRITVLDAGEMPRWSAANTDLRVYALSKSAQRVLAAGDALPGIARRRMSVYERMRVWEGAALHSAAQLCFDSAETGERDLGHIVEDSLIRFALFEVLQRSSVVEILFGRKLKSIDVSERNVFLALENQAQPLAAHLLIGADGAQSQVRAAAQFSSIERDYAQHALVGHVTTERSHARTAWQRFLPGGPLALLPLADGRASFVWSLPRTEARHWLECDPGEFERRLTYASGGVLGALRLDSERAALPLVARHAPEYCRSRLVLVGDAAHSVHPLAGQGVNLGLADAAELAQQITSAVIDTQDPGDLRVLQRYERARKGTNLLMLGALDGLDRLFRAPRWLAPMRSAGLRLVNRLPLLKNQLIRHASGDTSL
jgi:2-octaprenylphenol hydroxylase